MSQEEDQEGLIARDLAAGPMAYLPWPYILNVLCNSAHLHLELQRALQQTLASRELASTALSPIVTFADVRMTADPENSDCVLGTRRRYCGLGRNDGHSEPGN